MLGKVLVLFCAAAVVLSHEVEYTTPTPITSTVAAYTTGPEITSYSSPAPVSNTYLPDPTEVKIGSNYKKYSSAYSVAPVYSTTPASYYSPSTYSNYPTAAPYVKSTIAPSVRFSISTVSGGPVTSYPSYQQAYASPVVKSSFLSQPLSQYYAGVPAVAPAAYSVSPASYSTYPARSYGSYVSSTPAPVVSSTLGYASSYPLSYSAVSPAVASYSTPSPSYYIKPVPLKAQVSYAVPSYSSPALPVTYGSQPLVQTVGTPYQVGQGVQYVSAPQYSSYAVPRVGSLAYPSVSVGSPVTYGRAYGWKK